MCPRFERSASKGVWPDLADTRGNSRRAAMPVSSSLTCHGQLPGHASRFFAFKIQPLFEEIWIPGRAVESDDSSNPVSSTGRSLLRLCREQAI